MGKLALALCALSLGGFTFKDVVFSEAKFFAFDPTAKEVFVSPPLQATPSQIDGVDSKGREISLTPKLPQKEKPLLYEGEGVEATSQGVKLSSLKASCASCHTQGSPKGDFVMFDSKGELLPKVDWKLVHQRVNVDKDMPPATSGKPKPSAEDGKEVEVLGQ
jgi:hypothetical protein